MKTLAWCWLAMAASAFFSVARQPIPFLLLIIPSALILGYKLSELSRVRNWDDSKLFFIWFILTVTAGLPAFLIMLWRVATRP